MCRIALVLSVGIAALIILRIGWHFRPPFLSVRCQFDDFLGLLATSLQASFLMKVSSNMEISSQQ
jgi:hypothetical protein